MTALRRMIAALAGSRATAGRGQGSARGLYEIEQVQADPLGPTAFQVWEVRRKLMGTYPTLDDARWAFPAAELKGGSS